MLPKSVSAHAHGAVYLLYAWNYEIARIFGRLYMRVCWWNSINGNWCARTRWGLTMTSNYCLATVLWFTLQWTTVAVRNCASLAVNQGNDIVLLVARPVFTAIASFVDWPQVQSIRKDIDIVLLTACKKPKSFIITRCFQILKAILNYNNNLPYYRLQNRSRLFCRILHNKTSRFFSFLQPKAASEPNSVIPQSFT